jgi:hypothetical protein
VRLRLADAGEFYVDGAAEARVEKQIPAGVMVVVIDIDIVTVPTPVAAVRHIVGSDDPIGAVVEDDVACANIETASNVVLLHVFVTAVRIVTAGLDAIAVVIPVRVVGVVRIIPAFVFSIVVAALVLGAIMIVAVVFLCAAVLAVVVYRRRKGGRITGNETPQGKQNCTCKKSPAHYLVSPSGD